MASSVKHLNNIPDQSENQMLIKVSNSNPNNNNKKNSKENINTKNLTLEEKELYKKQTELLSQIKSLEEKLNFEKEQHQFLIESKEEEIEHKKKTIEQIKSVNEKLQNEFKNLQTKAQENMDKLENKEKNDKNEKEKQNRQNSLEQMLKVKEKELSNSNYQVDKFTKEKEKLRKKLDETININEINYLKDQIKVAKEKVDELKKEKKYLTEEEIWHYFIQISLGLAYIHSKNILHRDLKPMNIFLTNKNQVKIGDLGVAKLLSANANASTCIGTPYYLSPEICKEKPYNSKGDVWALGCILYELSTFNKPFVASNPAALILKIINGNFTPLSEIKNGQKYSKDLENMITNILQKDYEIRPLMKDIISNTIMKIRLTPIHKQS